MNPLKSTRYWKDRCEIYAERALRLSQEVEQLKLRLKRAEAHLEQCQSDTWTRERTSPGGRVRGTV